MFHEVPNVLGLSHKQLALFLLHDVFFFPVVLNDEIVNVFREFLHVVVDVLLEGVEAV